jgi:hypothetical protein
MFQWREIDVDGNLSYELEWVDHPVDWRSFRHPAHHRDPDQMPFGSATFHAPVVKLAGFRLGPTIVRAMPGRVEAKPDFSHLRPNMAASFRVTGNKLLSSEVPDSPQLGDLKVSWWSAPLQQVTVIARNYKGTLKPATDATDGKGFGLQVGQREVVDLEPDLPPEPLWPWLWRALSLVLASLGAYALLCGAQACRKDGIAAVGIGVTVICGLAGVMWLVALPRVSIGLIVIAVLALVVVAWRLYDRSPRTKRT